MKLKKRKLSKGLKKFIRKEKSKIRKNEPDKVQQDKLIKALYKK